MFPTNCTLALVGNILAKMHDCGYPSLSFGYRIKTQLGRKYQEMGPSKKNNEEIIIDPVVYLPMPTERQ
jgi:hypothetical protein